MESNFLRPPIFQEVIEGSVPLNHDVFQGQDGLVHQIVSPNEGLILYPDPHITVINRNVGLPNTVVVINDRDILAGIAGAERPEFIFNPKTKELEIIDGGKIQCSQIVDGYSENGQYWFSINGVFQQLGERIVRFKNDGGRWQFSLVIARKKEVEIEIINPQLVNDLLNALQIGDIKDLIALLFDPQTSLELKELILQGLEVASNKDVPLIMSTLLPNRWDLNFTGIFNPTDILGTRKRVLRFVSKIREATPEEQGLIEELISGNNQS